MTNAYPTHPIHINKSQSGPLTSLSTSHQPLPPPTASTSTSYSRTGILPPLRTNSPESDSSRPFSYDEPNLHSFQNQNHQRNHSISSQHSQPPLIPQSIQSNSTDLSSDSWSSNPGPFRSRTGSTFSLNGHMEGLTTNTSNNSSTDSPPIPPSSFPIRSHLPHLFHNDRRNSLDDRPYNNSNNPAPIRNFSWDHYSKDSPNQSPNPSGSAQSGRHWPWPSNYGGPHGRHQSVSGAPLQYDQHHRAGNGVGVAGVGQAFYPQPHGSVGHQPQWATNGGGPFGDSGGMGSSASAAGRIRSASASAMGRMAAHPYGLGESHHHHLPGYPSHLDPSLPSLPPFPSNVGPSSHAPKTAVPTGTGTPRRTKFKRSRTGCLMCRKRKVKCAQDGTPCKQCRVGKRECVYEEVPVKRRRASKKGSNASQTASAAQEAMERSNSGNFHSGHPDYNDLR